MLGPTFVVGAAASLAARSLTDLSRIALDVSLTAADTEFLETDLSIETIGRTSAPGHAEFVSTDLPFVGAVDVCAAAESAGVAVADRTILGTFGVGRAERSADVQVTGFDAAALVGGVACGGTILGVGVTGLAHPTVCVAHTTVIATTPIFEDGRVLEGAHVL